MDAMYRRLKFLWGMTFIGVMVLPLIVLIIPLENIVIEQELAMYFLYAAAVLFMATVVMSRFMQSARSPVETDDPREAMRQTQRFMALVGLADAPVMMGLVYYLLSRDSNGLMICVALSIIGFLLIRPVRSRLV